MNWIYNGKELIEVPEDMFGFIYVITYKDKTRYLGKRQFFKDVRLKPRKNDRVNAKRIVKRESDWKTYVGSTKLSKGKEIESKEIIHLCRTKTDLTYWEVYYMFVNNVLFDDNWINQNILGKFFPSEQLTGSKEYIKFDV